MYKFTDKQRQRLLEDALVADLLHPQPSAQPGTGRPAGRPAPAAAANQVLGPAAAA